MHKSFVRVLNGGASVPLSELNRKPRSVMDERNGSVFERASPGFVISSRDLALCDSCIVQRTMKRAVKSRRLRHRFPFTMKRTLGRKIFLGGFLVLSITGLQQRLVKVSCWKHKVEV